MEQARGRAAADDFDFDARAPEVGGDGAQQFAQLRQRGVALLLDIFNVARIERDPFQRQVRHAQDALGQLQQRLARRHSHPAQPDIHFRQHADFDLRRARGV